MKTEITESQASALQLVLIANKSAGQNTYHPAERLLLVAIDPPADPNARGLPKFVISETGPFGKTTFRRERYFYLVDDFEEAAAIFAKPLAE